MLGVSLGVGDELLEDARVMLSVNGDCVGLELTTEDEDDASTIRSTLGIRKCNNSRRYERHKQPHPHHTSHSHH